MARISDNLELEIYASSNESPNHEVSVLKEDISVAREVVTENPHLIEIEKNVVIQKTFILKEKILVPKVLEIDIPDSEESSKMEIASQESIESRMDISSQESSISLMDVASNSSQETDAVTLTISDGCVLNEGEVARRKAHDKDDYGEGNDGDGISPTNVSCESGSTSEHPPLPPKDKSSVPNEDKAVEESNLGSEISGVNLLGTQKGGFKRKVSISADNMRLATEKSLLFREDAISAREAACMARERALQEREAAVVSQQINLRLAAENYSSMPKRAKLIGGLEYD